MTKQSYKNYLLDIKLKKLSDTKLTIIGSTKNKIKFKGKIGNKCIKCNNKTITRSYCFYHWIRNKSKVHKIDYKILLEKLNSQQYKCKYSGILLIPGINASVDHIFPLSLGGANHKENIVWCDTKINYMKRNFTLDEFLTLCEQIYIYNKEIK